ASVLVVVAVTVLVRGTPLTANSVSLTVRVKAAVAPLANEAIVQVTVPPAPGGGVVQTKTGPLVWLRETKVRWAGRGSLRETAAASLGPLFVMPRLKTTRLPGKTARAPAVL